MPSTPAEHQPPGNLSEPPSDENCRLITLSHRLALADPHDTNAEAEKASFCVLRCQTRTQLILLRVMEMVKPSPTEGVC